MAATQYLYMQQGQPIAQRAGSISRSYQYDGMGSVRRMVRNNGNISDTFRFDMFGEVVSRTGTTKTPFSWNVGAGMQTGPDGLYVQQTIGYVAPLTTGSPKFGAGGSIWNDQGGSSFGPPPALPRAWISGGIVWVQLGDGPPIKIDLGWLWDVIGPPIYVIERPWTGAIGPPTTVPPPTVVPPPGGGRTGPPIGGATGDTPGPLGGPHPDFVCPECRPCREILTSPTTSTDAFDISELEIGKEILDCVRKEDTPLDCIVGMGGGIISDIFAEYIACKAMAEIYQNFGFRGGQGGTDCNPCANPTATNTEKECCEMKWIACRLKCKPTDIAGCIIKCNADYIKCDPDAIIVR